MTPIPQIPLNDGHTIPQFGLGVWQMTDDDVATAVHAAVEIGYRHFDTATLYKNEAAVGKALRESGLDRDEYFVTTKLWNTSHLEAEKACEESLQKLRMDHVDLYLIHWPSPARGKPLEAWDALIRLRERGLARSIGVANFSVPYLTQLVEHTDVMPATNQIELHPTLAQKELRAMNAQHGIVTESWSPLGQAKELDHPVIKQIAESNGITPAQTIIAWHLAHGIVVFPKSSHPQRLQENFDALGVTLSTEDMALLDGLDCGNRVGPDPDTADF